MHWIERLVDSFSESEAPPRFFYWAGMATIAATMTKNVYLDRFMYRLYPNIYVFTIAGSGMKKGVPINVARELLAEVNVTRIISGRNSVQKILEDLALPVNTSRGMLKEAYGILLSGELAAFLVKDPDALTMLTDVHDTQYNQKEWTYNLKSGVAKLHQPCLTMLGATNEQHLEAAVSESDIKGGFIARTFIVYSNVPGNYNDLTERPKRLVKMSEFTPYLTLLSQVHGEMKWSPEAKEVYKTWYHPHARGVENDPTGTERRLGDQILKAAMLISLSESTELILQPRHIEEALREGLKCASHVKIVQGQRVTMMGKPIQIILRELLNAERNTRTRQWFLKCFWNNGLSSQEFDISMETYVAAGSVIVNGNTNEKMSYVLQPSVVEEYRMQEKALKEM